MEMKKYRQEIKKIRETIYGTPPDQVQNLGLLGTYSLVSANLLRFLKLDADQHYKMVQDVQFHRSLSNLDPHFPHTLENLKVRDKTDALETTSDKGHIFVTFHTGSYRLFIQHLNKTGTPFCLVTEGKFIEQQGSLTQTLFKQVNAEGKGLEILEAENPRLLLELIKRINSGISVVFYIDGNTGSSDKKVSENKNLFKIDFLGGHIYARQGISMLAYLTKAQVILALQKRNKNFSNSLTLTRIDTSKYRNSSRGEFVNGVTKSLFDHLENFLKKFPEQWEGWFYIQKFFEEELHDEVTTDAAGIQYPGKQHITVGTDQYIQMVKYDGDNVFVINKRDYQIMKVTPMLYDVLSYFSTPKVVTTNTNTVINQHQIEWGFVAELIEMKLLSA